MVSRIALVHAVPMAMPPIEAAFQRAWPEAVRWNLLDDGLPGALERAGAMTEGLKARIGRLAEHAVLSGADGVLFTCSAFGPAIVQAAGALPVPVLRPEQAMFEAALAAGRRIGLLASFAPTVPSMVADLQALAAARSQEVVIDQVCVPEALAASRVGDLETHHHLLAQAANRLAACDVVMLAQFSTSTAWREVQAVLPCPVLTSPDAAVRELRRRCGGASDH